MPENSVLLGPFRALCLIENYSVSKVYGYIKGTWSEVQFDAFIHKIFMYF